MKNKIVVFTAFVLLAAVQLFFPAKMIFDNENIISTGSEFRFKCAPVDPTDAFRGKYISLSFLENELKIEQDSNWTPEMTAYVTLTKDSAGYAKLQNLTKDKPTQNPDYFKGNIQSIDWQNRKIALKFPFDRYYMEESKASDAETIYRKAVMDRSTEVWALVSIKDGEAVLKDVVIDNVSINDLISQQRKK